MSIGTMASLTKDQIDSIFEEADHQVDYVIGLYREVIPGWEQIHRLSGYPRVSKKTSTYIYRKVQEFDEEHHPNCLPGGLWMNKGFSTDKELEDWMVDLSEVEVVEQTERQSQLFEEDEA